MNAGNECKASLLGWPSACFDVAQRLQDLGYLSSSHIADEICLFMKMAAPFAKGFSTAYKRARSQDSSTPLASPPVLKATKIEEDAAQDDAEIPAFLRQSSACKFAAYCCSCIRKRASCSLCRSSTKAEQLSGLSSMTYCGKRNFASCKVEMIPPRNGCKK